MADFLLLYLLGKLTDTAFFALGLAAGGYLLTRLLERRDGVRYERIR